MRAKADRYNAPTKPQPLPPDPDAQANPSSAPSNMDSAFFAHWSVRQLWQAHLIPVLTALLAILLSSAARIGLEYLKGPLIDCALGADLRRLLILALGGLLLVGFKAWTHYLYTLRFMGFKISALMAMREALFASLLHRPYARYLEKPSGTYLSLCTNRLESLERDYFGALWGSGQIFAELLLSFIFLAWIDLRLACYGLLALLPSILLPLVLARRQRRLQEVKMAAEDVNLSLLKEDLELRESLIANGAVEHFSQRFGSNLRQLLRQTMRFNVFYFASFEFNGLLCELAGFVVLFSALFRLQDFALSAGAVVAAMGIMDNLRGQITYLAGYIMEIQIARQVLQQVSNAVHEAADNEPARCEREPRCPREVLFQDVRFGYGEQTLFAGLNLRFQAPGLYQLSGPSGSGKSTLMSLLFHYREPDQGRILLDDLSVADIANLSASITVMRQEAIFFEASLRDNLSMFKAIPDERLLTEMQALGLDKYANPAALDEVLSQDGQRFSGGEARRLMLLRALLSPAPILILDEPFANLDAASLEQMAARLAQEKDRLIFLISHTALPAALEPLRRGRLQLDRASEPQLGQAESAVSFQCS